MSDFARKQLEKYGWSNGKGLGKEENGITKPITAVMKLDTHGVGHDRVNILASNWWCDAFNEATKGIKVENTKTGVSLSHTKPKVIKKLPLYTGTRKKFVKAEETNQNFVKSNSVNESNPSNSLCSDAIYKKCDSVRNKKKCMKAKHKRVLRQDSAHMPLKDKG